MMGLYDGVDGRTDAGSTAEVSKLLQVPVILVLDAAGAVRSAAASAMGFAGFDPEVIIAGVIADRVGGSRHERWARGALPTAGGAPPGVLPGGGRARLPQRHPWLVPPAE